MTVALKSGADLARTHVGRFRVVTYGELRAKATVVAAQILARYRDIEGGVVVAPILGGGGLPARLIVDALLPFELVSAVVPCQIKRYSGVGHGGEAEILLPLAPARVKGQIVIGVDDLVDGGQTLIAFGEHALAQGADKVDTAVIYAKPQSMFRPGYVAEEGVTQWLVMPGEEHAFMREVLEREEEVEMLESDERQSYFETLGLEARVVADCLKLQ